MKYQAKIADHRAIREVVNGNALKIVMQFPEGFRLNHS